MVPASSAPAGEKPIPVFAKILRGENLMSEACPISFKQIDEKVARCNGALTVATLGLAIFGGIHWLLPLLGADFFIRGFLDPKYSLFATVSKKALTALKAAPQMTNAGPKTFAARLGFGFCLLISILYFAGFAPAGNLFASVFMLFAFLEAAFGFCIACKIYPLLIRFR